MMPDNFAAFQEKVWGDVALQSELLPLRDGAALIARVVELGEQYGFRFDAADVERELNRKRRAWIERGLR